MENLAAKFIIIKFPHKTYKQYYMFQIHSLWGLVKEYDTMYSSTDIDMFIEGLKFGQPFAVIEIIDKTKPEEPPDEITNLRGESKEQETDDDLPF